MPVYFITAIDTDAGKSIATGYLAKYLKEQGERVITQKMVQTGCKGIAEDILMHRKIMGMELIEEDRNRITCPQVFDYPASPHLSAAIQGTHVDVKAVEESTRLLQEKYNYVLLEGAGGLHVPLNDRMNIIDYVQWQQLPVILVTSSRLGSINHTLLSLEVMKHRGIELKGLVYNHYPRKSGLIFNDSVKIFRKFLDQWHPHAHLWHLPEIKGQNESVLFEGLL